MNRPKKRILKYDFETTGAHVSLVDDPANNHSIVLMKSKDGKDTTDIRKEAEVLTTTTKDVSMTIEEIEQMKADLAIAQEANVANEELRKAKEVTDAKLEEDTIELEELRKAKEADATELEELRKAKEADTVELEELRKAKDLKETEEFISKAKELKADDAEVFGTVLKKCKYALDEADYGVLYEQLSKMKNIAESEDLLKSKGSAQPSTETKNKVEEQQEIYAEHLSKGIKPREASKLARTEMKARYEA